MKHFLFLLVSLVGWGYAVAQDVILMRSADEMKVTVVEITDTEVLYKMWGGSTEVLRLPLAEIFSVTYRNGEKELFLDDRAPNSSSVAADYPWPVVTKRYTPGDLFDEDGLRGVVVSVSDEGRHGLIMSLDQADLPWVSKELEPALAGSVEAVAGWTTVTYNYHGGVVLGLGDRKDGWNNRQRLIACLSSAGYTLADFPAFEWCQAKGRGWYLPAVDEMVGLWNLMGGAVGVEKVSNGEYGLMRKRFNGLMTRFGGTSYPSRYSIMYLCSSTEKDAGRYYECNLGCDPNVRWTIFKKSYGTMLATGCFKGGALSVRAVHKF